MAKKYLDENGLAYFWSKIKQYLATPTRAGLMSPTDKAKVDAITNDGTIAYYRKLEGSYITTTTGESTIAIPIASYSTADILLVDINGLDLVAGEDYTVSGSNIILTTPITEIGQTVHFVALRATTASTSDYSALKGDAGVMNAYPRSGATPLSANWLSETSGGSALTPEANQIYILMADSGEYTANTMFRWNGSAYEPLTSGGGSVESTSVPTADTIAEFDSTAHMNSTDMTETEVDNFVDALEVSGVTVSDYVVEQGTSGIWTYRKWNSGIAECWGSNLVTTSFGNTFGALYYGTFSVDLPSGLFTSVTSATATRGANGGNSNGLAWISLNYVGTNRLGAYIIDSVSQTLTLGFSYNVKGRWK